MQKQLLILILFFANAYSMQDGIQDLSDQEKQDLVHLVSYALPSLLPEIQNSIQVLSVEDKKNLMLLTALESPELLQALIKKAKFPFIFPNDGIGSQPICNAFISCNRASIEVLLEAGVSLDQKYKSNRSGQLVTLEEGLSEDGNIFSASIALLREYIN